MDFAVLGPLAVRVNGTELPLDGGRQWAVLAVLLMRPNTIVTTDTLVEELWGTKPTPTSINAVHGYVSRLRKRLGRDVIETRSPGYVLRVRPGTLDVQRFEDRLEQGSRLLAEGAAEEARRVLGEALALWRGPALADFRYESFARAEAARLEELKLVTLEERIEADIALGRHARLIGELEVFVAEHPHRERLRLQRMLALYRAGRQAEALEAYRQARAALDELGLKPGALLRQLEKQILTQDAALDVPRKRPLTAEPVALPGALVPTPPFLFVGRSDELAALRALLERVEEGEGGLVLIAAEAGGGKTRLVRELAHEAAARGVLTLYGTSDAAVGVPYEPLREWLEFLLGAVDSETLAECLGDQGQILARLVPELTRLTGAPPPPSGDIASDRYLLQSAAIDLLARLGRLHPLLVVADDAHWADAEMLHLLRRLARRVPGVRVVVLVAYRGEEVGSMFSDMLADLARFDGVTRLGIGRLSDVEVGEFIRSSSDAEATAAFVAAIHELTGGLPLLLCELWRDARERGVVEVSDAGVSLSRPTAELRGPERIRDIVRQRLSRLAPQTAVFVELAAVTGPQFELRVLAEATALDRGALIAAVEEAVEVGLVEELPEPTPGGRFTHELMRRAVYDRITGIRRAELHLRVGEAIERLHHDDLTDVLPELAHHFTIAAPMGGVERAVNYNRRAAEAATAAGTYEEAAARLSAALELGIADPRERARLQVELFKMFIETGRRPEAHAVLAAAFDAAAGLGDRGVPMEALVQRLGLQLGDPQGDPEAMRRDAEAAIEVFLELGDARGVARARRCRALWWEYEGRWGEAYAELERARVDADASGKQNVRREVVGSLARALCHGPTPVGEAIRRCEELRAQQPGDRVLEAVVTRCLSSLYAMAGRFDEARESVDRSSLFLDQLDHTTQSGIYRTHAAEARELLADPAGAQRELLARWHRKGGWDHTPDLRAMASAWYLALLYCDAGRWEDADRCLEYGRDVTVPASFRTAFVRGLAARARVAAHRRELDEAVQLARRGVELADQSDMLNLRARVWLALAEVQRAAGHAAEADAAVAEALALYEQKGNVAAVERLRATASA